MSHTDANHSDLGSSQPDKLDATGTTRQTQGPGQSDSSDKHTTMHRQLLNDIPGPDDVQEMRVEHSRNLSIQELSEMRSFMLGLSDEMRSSIGGLFEETRRAIKEDTENAIKPIGESCQRINRGLEDMSNSVASIKASTTELSKNVAGLHVDIKETQRDIECTHTCVREIASIVTPPSPLRLLLRPKKRAETTCR